MDFGNYSIFNHTENKSEYIGQTSWYIYFTNLFGNYMSDFDLMWLVKLRRF